jgi:ABC-type transport system involved in multi-copper enzyme maturation permease subunit
VEVSVHDPRFHIKSLKGVFEGVTAPLAIVACLIGASLIGAEWPSRTITTILTWEPRRVRVLTAKVLVAAFVGVVLALVALVALGLALLPAALLHGTTAGTTGTWWRGLGGVLLRGLALVAVATTIGFAIAAIGRNTAAALGALFAYVVIIERVVSIFVKGMMRWLIIGNAIVFVSGSNSSDVPHQTVIEAGIYLAALAVGLYVVAAALFRSRDVA